MKADLNGHGARVGQGILGWYGEGLHKGKDGAASILSTRKADRIL
jgi:hypothetical protein